MTDGLHKGVKFRRLKLVFFHNERHLPDMIAKQTDILSILKKNSSQVGLWGEEGKKKNYHSYFKN